MLRLRQRGQNQQRRRQRHDEQHPLRPPVRGEGLPPDESAADPDGAAGEGVEDEPEVRAYAVHEEPLPGVDYGE
ncbi:hypothetical protein GCM10010330_81390 [Streptomyces tendae]|nr:hypothetical protein GCM10010330_81390 [Streptomyces tendae]